MTTHHYPAIPNSTPSLAFPGMWVAGDRRRMLVEDASLARSLAKQAAATVLEWLADWQGATGPERAKERAAVRRGIDAQRRADAAARAAFSRLCREPGATVPRCVALAYTLDDVTDTVSDLGVMLDQHDAAEDDGERAEIADLIASDAQWLGAVVGRLGG